MALDVPIKKRGIVYRLSQTKENDAMVSCLGEEGFFVFYARGVMKVTSKNLAGVQELCESDFSLLSSPSGRLTLKEASPRKLWLKEGDFNAVAVSSFLSECLIKLAGEEEGKELYPWYRSSLEAIKNNFDPLTVGFVFLCHVLSICGYGLDVDGCVNCGNKKGIVALSYEDGGFLCRDCFDSNQESPTPVRTLKIIRYAFRCSLSDLTRVSFPKSELLPFFSRMVSYARDIAGVELKSAELIRRF